MSNDPTGDFAITPEQRARLVPNINVDSLERFLQIAGKSDEERHGLMQFFMRVPGQNYYLMGPVTDPTLKALLEEVYAPTWEAWGADAIENSESPLPGRELARANVMAKKAPSSND